MTATSERSRTETGQELSSAAVYEAAAVPGSEATIEAIASHLGVGIATGQGSPSELRFHTAIISDEEREQYGFGDLPDELIRQVRLEISYITPDHVAPDSSRLKLAAQTMLRVREQPDIDAVTLREMLDPQAAGIEFGDEIPPANLAVYGSAITIAHYFSSQYFDNNSHTIGGQ